MCLAPGADLPTGRAAAMAAQDPGGHPSSGPLAIAAQPGPAAQLMESFSSAPRAAVRSAMRSMMLNRPGMAGDAAGLRLPVLMMPVHGDGMGSSPADIRAVADTMSDARVARSPVRGHLAPLLIDPGTVFDRLRAFWR